MKILGALFLPAALLVFPLGTLRAHHSFAAEFDSSKPVTLKGVVARVAWMNPHVFLWVDVKDSAGKVVQWEVESSSPNGLMGAGWSKSSLKGGDAVTVEGHAAKDQEHLAKSSVVVLPDGRRIYTGSWEDTAH